MKGEGGGEYVGGARIEQGYSRRVQYSTVAGPAAQRWTCSDQMEMEESTISGTNIQYSMNDVRCLKGKRL